MTTRRRGSTGSAARLGQEVTDALCATLHGMDVELGDAKLLQWMLKWLFSWAMVHPSWADQLLKILRVSWISGATQIFTCFLSKCSSQK